ncbi:TPA: hypothetical protein L4G09_005640 [Pseudomonas aeruginosa]|nr:hypothetical protein [Pseudomonas aeruginosa]
MSEMNDDYQHQYGSIRTPDDLRAIPGYEEVVDFGQNSGRRLLEVLDDYEFAKVEEYPCGIKDCRTVHQYGYLVRATDGKLTNIGRFCGKRHLNLDFTRAHKVFREKRKAADNLKSIMAIREEFAPHQSRLDAILALSRVLSSCKESLREWLPSQYAHLVEMGRKGSNQIIQSRRMSKREAEIHYLQTGTSRKDYPGGRPIVEEAVARLDGCAFFQRSLALLLKKHLMPPIEQLQAMDDAQIQKLKPKDLENLSRNVNNALRLIQDAETIAEHGMRFFAADNLQKLTLMGVLPEQLDRLTPALAELTAVRAR